MAKQQSINEEPKSLSDFTNLYSLSKTLRFELKPIGKTKDNFERSGMLEQDQHRAESYLKVKKIIDRYHKALITLVLNDFNLKYGNEGKNDSLEEFQIAYDKNSKDESDKKVFSKIKDNLREQIAKAFKNNAAFKRIDKKELINEDLIEFVKTDNDSGQRDEETSLIEEFKGFTTYFTGFNTNRKNMYSADEQSTAIAYRLIHENLPKFIDNFKAFNKIKESPVYSEMTTIYNNFEAYLNVNSIDEMFRLDYYNDVLTQPQIDVYNAIIGGKTEADGTKIQGLNEYINLYNQKQTDKNKRLPKLVSLYKQILSDRVAISWLEDEFDKGHDNDVLKAISDFYNFYERELLNRKHEEGVSLRHLLKNISDYNLNGIFIKNDLALTDISQKVYGRWDVISNAIIDDLKRNNGLKGKEKAEKYEERISKLYKNIDSFSIEYINTCVHNYDSEQPCIHSYFATLGATEDGMNVFSYIKYAYDDVKTLLTSEYPKDKNLVQDKDNIEKIKTLLDKFKALQHFCKLLAGSGNEPNKDIAFYSDYDVLYKELDTITVLYNKVRNYLTRKPYSTDKIKLNFNNSTLMDGWDVNKERDNTSILLKKDGLYYLAIMNKSFNKVFDADRLQSDGDCYEKIVYKYLPGPNKMLPKVFFSKSRINFFGPDKLLIERYNAGTHKKGPNFNLNDCRNLIDFFKRSINIHEDWKTFNFKFSDTNTYNDLSDFYKEVADQGYKITYKKVSCAYVNQLVDEGKIYLFQIYNKDFSPYSKGTPNLHTLYWKMLFDERNLADVVYKLNGQAEVFYRKKSLNYTKPTHPANMPIRNKNEENKKRESTFDYDIMKDKRYTVDKFQFHVPISMNFKSGDARDINLKVREFIKNSNDLHIIGIDRGERNLLYLSVIDLQGNIKEQVSLNEIINEYNGNTYKTNYHNLLDRREDERLKARQSWQTIENIKELKEGYLSQVVHKITQLMIKYNAIVVLEDLNFGFMRSRQKVEKQVYEKFEKMLIDKLNYLADKKADPNSVGGLLKAYQFTNKFESFKKMGKQNGFLFYVPAWNTSKIDPVTGFTNLLDTRYETVSKAKDFFSKFDNIIYNESKDRFEFNVDYNKFTTKATGTRTNWTLCSYGTRIDTFRNSKNNNEWDSKEIFLTDEFKKFFIDYNIDIHSNLKNAILNQEGKEFYTRLLHLLKLVIQLRNSRTGTSEDYILSPVSDDNGDFFDSRKGIKNLPIDADANGAYNIARKGLWAVEQIKMATDLNKVKFAISNKDWLAFVQLKAD